MSRPQDREQTNNVQYKIRGLFSDLRGAGGDVDRVEKIVKEFKLGDDE